MLALTQCWYWTFLKVWSSLKRSDFEQMFLMCTTFLLLLFKNLYTALNLQPLNWSLSVELVTFNLQRLPSATSNPVKFIHQHWHSLDSNSEWNTLCYGALISSLLWYFNMRIDRLQTNNPQTNAFWSYLVYIKTDQANAVSGVTISL